MPPLRSGPKPLLALEVQLRFTLRAIHRPQTFSLWHYFSGVFKAMRPFVSVWLVFLIANAVAVRTAQSCQENGQGSGASRCTTPSPAPISLSAGVLSEHSLLDEEYASLGDVIELAAEFEPLEAVALLQSYLLQFETEADFWQALGDAHFRAHKYKLALYAHKRALNQTIFHHGNMSNVRSKSNFFRTYVYFMYLDKHHACVSDNADAVYSWSCSGGSCARFPLRRGAASSALGENHQLSCFPRKLKLSL